MDTKSEKYSDIEIEDVQQTTWTEKEETTVRWLIDFRVVPIMFVLYLLCFLDRYVLVSTILQCLSMREINQRHQQSKYWVMRNPFRKRGTRTLLTGMK